MKESENIMKTLIQVPTSVKSTPIMILDFVPHLLIAKIERKLLGMYIMKKMKFVRFDSKTERS
jgi:hypothetical protein